MNPLLRLLRILLALTFLGFATFGFLASFELPSMAERFPWLIGYASLAIIGIYVGARAFLREGRNSPDEGRVGD